MRFAKAKYSPAPNSTNSNYQIGGSDEWKNPKVYKYCVNEERFKSMSKPCVYIINLQRKARKKKEELGVIKVDRRTFEVISKSEA